jgi:hypothetical protein
VVRDPEVASAMVAGLVELPERTGRSFLRLFLVLIGIDLAPIGLKRYDDPIDHSGVLNKRL